MARRGTGRPNPSLETKLSCENGDREKICFRSVDNGTDWQPYPVDP